MARHLRRLPRREFAVDAAGQRLAAALQPLNLARHVHAGIVVEKPQLLDLAFQLRDGLLEVKK